MTVTIPTIEPASFTKGDTVKWTKSLSDYLPADGWVLSYAFVKDGSKQAATATNNGDGSHLVTISTTSSALFEIGIYYWQAYVTKASERYKVDEGRLEVKPNFADMSSGYDARSHVKKVRDALEATILGKASKDQMAYTINGRSLQSMPPADLIKWKNHYDILYKQELQAEGIAKGNAPANKGQVRF